MRQFLCVFCVLALAIAWAAPAAADDDVSARDLDAAVAGYLADTPDAALVGGPGSAGYDAGFWIRGGDFLLRINATLQARFEAWDYDDEDQAERELGLFGGLDAFAGDTSGFSLPRATVKLSGEAPCDVCWYMELEFGHFGRDLTDVQIPQDLGATFFGSTRNYDNTREAWIEWCSCDAFNVRMGQVKLPTTRQLMVVPELQQFVDISLASSFTGVWGIGYTDRNRDHGLLVHGSFGCNNEWSYMVSVTNGDGGDSVRNVLDHRTSDNLAYAARLNWAFLGPIGYEEGALRQQTCGWYGELGAWAQIYNDRFDKAHTTDVDYTAYGLDLALGYGGFSFTAAATIIDLAEFSVAGGEDVDALIWLAQLGYHFPGTAWEIAARVSAVDTDFGMVGNDGDGTIFEYALGVNYYLNGHGNKLQLDVSFLETEDSAFLWYDYYPGYQPLGDPGGNDTAEAILIRFQWQLAL